jgi:hypothetical protein
MLRVDAVAVVDPAGITDEDARRAGFAGRAELLRELDRRGDGPVYRVDFHLAGPDPREALRQADTMAEEGWAAGSPAWTAPAGVARGRWRCCA